MKAEHKGLVIWARSFHLEAALQLNFSLCLTVLPPHPFCRCGFQVHSSINILSTKLCVRGCSLGNSNTSIQGSILHLFSCHTAWFPLVILSSVPTSTTLHTSTSVFCLDLHCEFWVWICTLFFYTSTWVVHEHLKTQGSQDWAHLKLPQHPSPSLSVLIPTVTERSYLVNSFSLGL